MENRFAIYEDAEFNADYLTGLMNRRGLNEVWNSLPATFMLHCIYLDVDNFKLVNDVYGHSKGDELLIFVSSLLKRTFADQVVVRMGGDEFCILCDGEIASSEIEDKFPMLQRALADADFDGSIDDAMYYIKRNGKCGFVNYDTISTMMEERKAIKTRAKYALENEEISILLSPIVFLQTSDVYAAEVVLEWRFPSLGILTEDRFLPVFEQYGIIGQMNAIAFEKVCEWKESWKGTAFENFEIYIKLSSAFILQKSGIEFIKWCTSQYQINPSEIAIGIEESQFLESKNKMLEAVAVLKKMGFEIAINNFGSASSLLVLQNASSRVLKLDEKLLDAAEQTTVGMQILRNVISLGRDLCCMIIAQGVNTASRISMLANYGAQVGTGDFYGAPLREIDFRCKYKNKLLHSRNIKPVSFSFQDNLLDDAGDYEGKYNGWDLTYCTGVVDSQKSIHFQGGDV